MNKKEYIQPIIQPIHINPSTMICGSGGETSTLSGGSSGEEPTATDGIITGDAKSVFGFDSDEEE